MYLPPHFAQTDPAALQRLMREHPLATVIVGAPDGQASADLLPLHFDAEAGPQGCLRGHVARANPLWQHAGAPVLVVFHGPQAYVTPSWYPSKAEHGKVVPTWNYSMVQARGPLQVVQDAPWLRGLVGLLTDTHESGRAKPWGVGDAPEDYVQQMLRAIVGIEIPLQSLVGKWKLSQNRNVGDLAGVRQGLAQEKLPQAQVMAHQMAGPAGA